MKIGRRLSLFHHEILCFCVVFWQILFVNKYVLTIVNKPKFENEDFKLNNLSKQNFRQVRWKALPHVTVWRFWINPVLKFSHLNGYNLHNWDSSRIPFSILTLSKTYRMAIHRLFVREAGKFITLEMFFSCNTYCYPKG